MTQQDIESLKDRVVASLAGLAPAGWKCLFLDFEVQDVGHELVWSPVAIAVIKRLIRAPEKVDLAVAADRSVCEAAKELAISLMRSKETKVVTIDVLVQPNGESWWQFDFSPPPRLTAMRSGDLTAEYRDETLRMQYIKFANQDEWLAKIISKHEARLIARTPAGQFREIVRMTAGFATAAAEQEREESVNLYLERCINGIDCLEDDVAVALPGLRRAAEDLALCTAFVDPNAGRLGEALAEYVVSNFLHYRALRSRIWHLEKQNLFGVDLAGFGFAACAAVAFGAHHEGQWLSREYIRHVSQQYDDPYSVDTEFVQFCDWLLTWYVTGRANPEKCPNGIYSALARSMHDGPSLARAMQSVLDARTDHAYRQFVLEEEGAEPRFYRQLFSASFPFELLAFKVLVERDQNVSIDLAHPAADHLKNIRLPERHALSEFALATERRLERLEFELGLVDAG